MSSTIKPGQAYQYRHTFPLNGDLLWVTAKPVDVDGILVTNPLAGNPGTLVYLFHDKQRGVHH